MHGMQVGAGEGGGWWGGHDFGVRHDSASRHHESVAHSMHPDTAHSVGVGVTGAGGGGGIGGGLLHSYYQSDVQRVVSGGSFEGVGVGVGVGDWGGAHNYYYQSDQQQGVSAGGGGHALGGGSSVQEAAGSRSGGGPAVPEESTDLDRY
jgi:hypothetical protein